MDPKNRNSTGDNSDPPSPGRKNSKCKTCDDKDCYIKNTKGQKQKFLSKWIKCDLCREWFHGMCQSLANKNVDFLDNMDNKGVKWFCDMCIPQLESAIGGQADGKLAPLADNSMANSKLRTIEEMVSKIASTMNISNAALDARMEKLETSYAEAVKSNTEGMKKGIEINSSAKVLLERNIEHSQTEQRKNNAIIYGVREEDGKRAHEQIMEIMRKDCFQSTKQPIKVTRLQTAGPRNGNPARPIKVEFPDEHSKWEFLKRANATLRADKIFCKLDESKETRDRQYALRQQIKQMKENDDSDKEYRIRNLKIQVKTDSGEWENLIKREEKKTSTV